MIRFFDITFSILGIVFLFPVFVAVSFLIKFTSTGPIFYLQNRVGRGNVDFHIFKFRTMKINSDRMSLITIGGNDPRVTKVGYFLRKYKLDELPQLFNVLIGDMSLVGPRPEVRKYVDLYTKEQIRILDVRPGITDWASIIYRNENDILEKSLNPEHTYIEEIMPDKIGYNLIYINRYNVFQYFKIIIFTMLKILNSNIIFNVKPIV